ncbi:MAG TPA: hypothetical protein VFX59_31160 [Polyangiales bacterium]|nr:hypothetical protein [Polyangiales bacterium]
MLGSIPWLLSSALGGCYAHHTADEELLDIGFPEEAYPDAGAARDAGPINKCTQTDPIQLLLCQVTSGGGLGGLGGLGGTGTGTGTGTGQTPDLGGLQDIIDLLGGAGGAGGGTNTGAGGLQDIIDLLGGLNGGGLNGGGQGTGTGANPFQDFLDQLNAGRRDAGAPVPPPATGGVTEAQCAKATDLQTRFLCAVNGFATPAQGRRDGGTGFSWPFPVPGQNTGDAGVPTVY